MTQPVGAGDRASTAVIADIGDVMQLAFVPADFDATLKLWIETMGAGPFYLLRARHEEFAQFNGRDTRPDLTIALGYWGDMQIEIIRQENEAPSPFREWRQAGHDGLQHICVLTDDIGTARQTMAAAGATIVFEARAFGAAWFYADTGGGPGTMVEVTCHSERSAALMAMIRESHDTWDGSDPVRVLS